MLSSMDTPRGLTIVGPDGKSVRVQRNSPALPGIKRLLQAGMPAEQTWKQVCDLLANPLQALVEWASRFDVRLADLGSAGLSVGGKAFARSWLPLFERCMATGGSPLPVIALADKLSHQALKTDTLCVHWVSNEARVVVKASLPVDARLGDKVLGTPAGPQLGLVSYSDFSIGTDNQLVLKEGTVLAKGLTAHQADRVLEEPAILGMNRTYRCEEGSADGWLEDLSFDSLSEAKKNAAEIIATGAEARIVNRISGSVVSLH